MQIGHILKNNIIIYGNYELEKGGRYVMPKSILDHMNSIYPRCVREKGNFDNYYNHLNFKDISNGKKIFLFRSGGIGDLMFMLPLVHYIKKFFDVEIKVATTTTYTSIFRNNPYVDKIIIMPFKVEELENSDLHLMFENVIENNPEAEKNHAVDLFFGQAGIDYKGISDEEKIPKLFLSEDELKKGEVVVNRLSGNMKNSKKIGIQISASSPIRTFPLDKFVDIIEELVEKDYFVFLFGGYRQSEEASYIESIVKKNLCNLIKFKLSLRDSIIITKFLDLVIAPDSAFIHIAGALGVPIIGLYGCFPSLVRMRYYKNAIGIDCAVSCSPSFLHGHNPCKKGFPSPCFSVISIKNVLDAVAHFLEGTSIKKEYPEYNEFKKGIPIRTIGM